jgi:hypothetical protein
MEKIKIFVKDGDKMFLKEGNKIFLKEGKSSRRMEIKF